MNARTRNAILAALCLLAAPPARAATPVLTQKTAVIDGMEWKYCELDEDFPAAGQKKGDIYIGHGLNTGPAIDPAFSGHLDIPDFGGKAVQIHGDAFLNCTGIVSVAVPEGVKVLAKNAFAGCTGLESVDFPDSLSEIFLDAFNGCTSLEAVTIPAGTASVASSAFAGCTNLRSVTFLGIPSDHAYVPAFNGCPALRSITLADADDWLLRAIPAVEELHALESSATLSDADGVLFNADGTELLRFPGKRGGHYAVPEGTKRLGADSFYHCDAISSVEVPPSVTDIAGSAFSSTSLVSVAGCEGVETIGAGAFRYCPALVSFAFGESLGTIEESAFAGCPLASADFRPGLAGIGASAFSGCTNLAAVAIPQGTAELGASAFKACDGLRSASIPGTVSAIGASAFAYCPALESVEIGNGVRSIGNSAFSMDSALAELELPDSVETVGQEAFYGCTGLQSVDLGRGVRSIGRFAFAFCPLYDPLSFPDSLETIGYQSFAGGRLPPWFVIPGNAASMAPDTFDRATGLKVLYLPETLDVDAAAIKRPDGCDAVRYAGSPLFFSVFSPSGPGGPLGKGHVHAPGDTVECAVPEISASNGWRVACEGWTGTGSVPASGTGSAVSFEIAEHSTLEWKWGGTNVWISCALSGPATAGFSEGWIPLGESVTVAWTPTEDGTAATLSGDTDGVVLDAAARTLTIPADRPRTLELTIAGPPRFTTSTPVPVPYAWLERHPAGLAGCGGDHEAFANSRAANGRAVWACYVAGLAPTNAEEDFTVSISAADGTPRVSWTPDLSDDPENPRVYSVFGKTGMKDEEAWHFPTNDASRFFKVEVSLPEPEP